ncbi:MAG: hypothetical protein AAGG75_08585 [Bacteroidota bacterium]
MTRLFLLLVSGGLGQLLPGNTTAQYNTGTSQCGGIVLLSDSPFFTSITTLTRSQTFPGWKQVAITRNYKLIRSPNALQWIRT